MAEESFFFFPTKPESALCCAECGARANEWTVHVLSLCTRCITCKNVISATSWEPALSVCHWPVRVYRDGDDGGAPVLEGIASALHDRILELAVGGAVLVLRPVTDHTHPV